MNLLSAVKYLGLVTWAGMVTAGIYSMFGDIPHVTGFAWALVPGIVLPFVLAIYLLSDPGQIVHGYNLPSVLWRAWKANGWSGSQALVFFVVAQTQLTAAMAIRAVDDGLGESIGLIIVAYAPILGASGIAAHCTFNRSPAS